MIGPMTLLQLVEDVDSLDDELTVFWNPDESLASDSAVFVVDLDEEDEPEGLKEFIDVWHIRDVIKGKSSLAGLDAPNAEAKTALLLDYAETGA